MPADVAARLDAALRRPSPRADRSGAAVDAGPGPRGGAGADAGRRPRRRGRGRRRRRRCAGPRRSRSPPASLAFAGLGVGQLDRRRDDRGRADRRPQRRRRRRRGRRRGGRRARRRSRQRLDDRPATDYRRRRSVQAAQPARAAAARPRQRRPRAAADAGRSPPRAGLARLRAPAALPACLDAIARRARPRPITVRLVDYARFDGHAGAGRARSRAGDGALGVGRRPGLRRARRRRRHARYESRYAERRRADVTRDVTTGRRAAGMTASYDDVLACDVADRSSANTD